MIGAKVHRNTAALGRFHRAILVCLLSLATPLLADVLILRNGTTVEGTLLGQTRSEILMLVRGRRTSYGKKDVRSVRYSESSEEGSQGQVQRKQTAELRRRADQLKKLRDANQIKAELEKQRAALDALLRSIEAVFQKQEERRKLTDALNADLDRRDKLRRQSEADWPFVWRSLLVPGWGQVRNGDTGWGIFFASSIGALSVAYWRARDTYGDAKARFQDQNAPLALTYGFLSGLEPTYRSANIAPVGNILLMSVYGGARRQELDRTKRTVNVMAVGIGALWFWNVMHALVSERPLDKAPAAVSGRPQFSLSALPDQGDGPTQAKASSTRFDFHARIAF